MVLSALAAGCERNRLVGPVPEPALGLTKFHAPHGAKLVRSADGWLLAAGPAGITLIDTAGTPADPSDDRLLTHDETNLAGWQPGLVTDLCVDGTGAAWLLSGRTLSRLDLTGTPFDGGDDAIASIELEQPATRLLCPSTLSGAWAASDDGWRFVNPGEEPGTTAGWTVTLPPTAGPLAARAYAATVDPAGRLWLVNFEANAFHLHAVEPGSPSVHDDDTSVEVPLGFADPAPVELGPDGTTGLWVVGSGGLHQLDHAGTPLDPADDRWTTMPAAPSGGVERLFPAGPGRAFVMLSDGRRIALADSRGTVGTDDDVTISLPEFGLGSGNLLSGGLAEGDSGLWYSSGSGFGLLLLGANPAQDGWSLAPLKTGPAPGNDLTGFAGMAGLVFVSGASGVMEVPYRDGAPDPAAAVPHPLTDPESGGPSGIRAIIPYAGGLLAGGGRLAWLTGAQWTVWDKRSSPSGVNLLAAGPDSLVWVSSVQQSVVSLASVNIYDPNGTPANPGDDDWESLDTEWFGFGPSVGIDALHFLDNRRALVGNSLGLHLYDCSGTPADPDDDAVAGNLLDGVKLIRSIESDRNGGFWLMSVTGLIHFQPGAQADMSDAVTTRFDPLPGAGYRLTVDEAGLLYYFVKDGLLVHDPAGTPADPSDDLACLVMTRSERNALLHADGAGGLWFGYGDGTGIYHAVVRDCSFGPLDSFDD